MNVNHSKKDDLNLSGLRADETQPSDFIRTLNSLMDNLENVVVNFEKTLSVVLEKIEKLESLEISSQDDKMLNGNKITAGETKQLTNDAATVEMPYQGTNETGTKTEMTTNNGTNHPRFENAFQESAASTVKESDTLKRSVFSATFGKMIKKASSKSDYCILAIALAILGIVIVKLYFILVP